MLIWCLTSCINSDLKKTKHESFSVTHNDVLIEDWSPFLFAVCHKQQRNNPPYQHYQHGGLHVSVVFSQAEVENSPVATRNICSNHVLRGGSIRALFSTSQFDMTSEK